MQYQPGQNAWSARVKVAVALWSAPLCGAYDTIAVCKRLLYGLLYIKPGYPILYQIYI